MTKKSKKVVFNHIFHVFLLLPCLFFNRGNFRVLAMVTKLQSKILKTINYDDEHLYE